MRCERIALPTEPYPHGRFTNSIIINTQKKCKHNYINRFTNFNCYGKIFFTWRHGSAGRAFASHARGHRFESCCLHQNQTKKNINFLEKREGPITDFFFLYWECDCYLINIKIVIHNIYIIAFTMIGIFLISKPILYESLRI